MESHLTRGRNDLLHARQHRHQAARHDAMTSFVSGFQDSRMEENKKALIEILLGGATQSSAEAQREGLCPPHQAALREKMDTLGYVDEATVEEAFARVRGEGATDLSSQCQFTIARDIFGYVPPHERHHHRQHSPESAYDAIKFIKDDVNWGGLWKR